jgi:ribosomal subunit interface protein
MSSSKPSLWAHTSARYNFTIMNTNIKAGSIELTPAISDYVDKRLKKVADLLENDPALKCDVELSRTTSHHNKGDIFRAEVHIVGSGKDIYVAREETDLYAAIDLVRDEVLREVKANKSKQISAVRRGGARMKNMMKGLWPWGKKGGEVV